MAAPDLGVPDAHEARAELLQQHALLRTKLERSREVAMRGGLRELHDALLDLGNLLRLHHLREEEVLRDVFPRLDEWTMIRAAATVEEHADEHRQLYETLLVVSCTEDLKRAAESTLELCDRILEHIEDETSLLELPEP